MSYGAVMVGGGLYLVTTRNLSKVGTGREEEESILQIHEHESKLIDSVGADTLFFFSTANSYAPR